MKTDGNQTLLIAISAIAFCGVLVWLTGSAPREAPDRARAAAPAPHGRFADGTRRDAAAEPGEARSPVLPPPVPDAEPGTLDEVRGVVRDDRRRAVAGVHVTATRHGGGPGIAATRSDRKGRFRLRNVLPGYHRVALTHPDHPRIRQDLEIVASELELVLPRFGSVELRIRTGEGVAAPDRVEILSHLRPRAPLRDGALTLDRIPPGLRTIRVRAPGFDVSRTQVRIAPGPANRPLTITLRQAVALEVQLVDDAGAPIPATRVRVGGRWWESSADGATDDRGWVRLTDVPVGLQTFHFQAGRSRWTSGTVRVEAGSRKLRIRLDDPGGRGPPHPAAFEWLE